MLVGLIANLNICIIIFRYKDYAAKLRTEAYAASSACALMPLSCPFVYGTVAAIVETKLKEYRESVSVLKRNSKTVVNTINKVLVELKKKVKQ